MHTRTRGMRRLVDRHPSERLVGQKAKLILSGKLRLDRNTLARSRLQAEPASRSLDSLPHAPHSKMVIALLPLRVGIETAAIVEHMEGQVLVAVVEPHLDVSRLAVKKGIEDRFACHHQQIVGERIAQCKRSARNAVTYRGVELPAYMRGHALNLLVDVSNVSVGLASGVDAAAVAALQRGLVHL